MDPASRFVFEWANHRLQKLLGQEVSDVVEYLLSIQDEGELLEFARGLLGDDDQVLAFMKDLSATRAKASTMSSTDCFGCADRGTGSEISSKKGGGPGGYMTGSPADKRLNKGGATNLRDLAGQKARREEEAQARLERNMSAASSSKTNIVDLAALPLPEEAGMKAYLKTETDEFGIAGAKKDSKKKKTPKQGSDPHVSDENAAPVVQKSKISRSERAQLLQTNQAYAFLAPGRHPCKWVGNGNEYKLVGNCLDCGKILSDQEGEGPCLVCGSEQVYLARTNAMLDGTPVNESVMAKRRRGGGSIFETDEVDAQLQERNAAEDLAFLKAMDLRDSLLDFEKNRAARTTVIDDQSDYFDSSAHWLTEQQQKEAAAKEKEFLDRVNRSRAGLPVTFSIDIAGRRIYSAQEQEETPLFPEGAAPPTAPAMPAQEQDTSANARGASGTRSSRGPTVDLMGPTGNVDMQLGARHGVLKDRSVGKAALQGRALEIYELLMANILSGDSGSGGGGCFAAGGEDSASHAPADAAGGCVGGGIEGVGAFVQDHSGDAGACLSMHQPWASLAVYGVKQIEGRDWPTEHRGRLWIAATKRRPLQEEIDAVLEQYEAIACAREGLQPFYMRPHVYPTSCILGCVDVVDCVPGEVLRQQADEGEEVTDCAYGFVLERACRLTLPPHVLGQPKIFQLDPPLVSRAQKQLREVVSLPVHH